MTVGADARAPAAGAGEGAQPGETSVMAVVGSVSSNRRLIAMCAVVGLLAGGIFGLTRPHLYTSHSSFTTDDQRSSVASSLGQLGLSGLLGAGSQSSQIYLDVLESPVILDPVLDSVYTVTVDDKTERTTLAALYRGRASNSIKARANARAKLSSEIKAELKPSGAVSVDVTTPDRALSQQIASRLLARLNQFTLERRQQRASTEREFNEERVAAARAELRAAESRLEAFMQGNRAFHNSPTLSVDEDRLQRDVAFRQSIYTAVAQAYEQARMEEARNTPTVSILEPADFPLVEAPRWGGLKAGLLGLVIGTIIGLGVSVLGDFFRRAARANPADAADVVRLR